MTNSIEVQVDHHPSGRFTLKEKAAGAPVWSDVEEGDLFGNIDAAAFFRAVAKRLAEHAAFGTVVTSYKDTAP